MTKKEIIAIIEKHIESLPNEIGDKVYDAVTIDEGISDCIDYGKWLAYNNVLELLK